MQSFSIHALEPPRASSRICFSAKIMQYDTGKHCVFYHRYPLPGRGMRSNPREDIVWSTKYRYKMLTGQLRLRVREICRQVCRENEVDILRGVLSSDHVHMFVPVPPKLAISDLVRKMNGDRYEYRFGRLDDNLDHQLWVLAARKHQNPDWSTAVWDTAEKRTRELYS